VRSGDEVRKCCQAGIRLDVVGRSMVHSNLRPRSGSAQYYRLPELGPVASW
jgi:hypothetical protein